MSAVTEYIYCCSPDFWRYLFLSLRSLLVTNPDVEAVRILMTGTPEQVQKLAKRVFDRRVIFENVPDIGQGYWYANKTHACTSKAERVVFLDADVAVLRPINPLWHAENADVLARLADVYYSGKFNEGAWRRLLSAAGCPNIPLFSDGFVIFQNRSHHRLHSLWVTVTQQIRAGILPAPINRFAEMYAFSIALGLANLSYRCLDERAHRYPFIGEPLEDAVVCHLGTPNFFRLYLHLERINGWNYCRLGVPRPRLLIFWHVLKRLQYHLKSRFFGPRTGWNKG